ncbi:MAG: hypothetical protein J6Z50_07270, partial [Fibrobacterales bacterium]|nr:hypothetical protein [Fibrobacterales bacterium]
MFPISFSRRPASELRREALAKVREMSADERAERSERIAGILRGELERTGVRALAAFWPMKSEPDLRPLLLEWAEADPEREL